MKLRLIALPILALGGFALTGVAVARFNTPPKTGPEPVSPPPIPFPDRVAGVGIVEPSSETIQVAAQVGGVVARIHVKEGDRVEAGATLVELDMRDALARIEIARAQVSSARTAVEGAKARAGTAKARVAQLRAKPRAEDMAEATALADARRAALAEAQGRLDRLLRVTDRGTAANEQPALEFAVAFAKAQVLEAEARLARVEAGTYPEDLAVAVADVDAALVDVRAAEDAVRITQEQLAQAEVARDLLVVRAPIAGTVLRLDARVGEYRASGPGGSGGGTGGTLLRLGDLSTMHVRTDIDELDSWRFDASGKAVATVRGGSRLQIPLRFVRIVPDVQPKRTLTGENGERIDTRVVQVIYALENPPAFLQPGMLVDVATAAKPSR